MYFVEENHDPSNLTHELVGVNRSIVEEGLHWQITDDLDNIGRNNLKIIENKNV